MYPYIMAAYIHLCLSEHECMSVLIAGLDTSHFRHPTETCYELSATYDTVQRILMKGAAGMDFIVLVCIRNCQMFTDHCFINASVYIFQSAVMYGTNNFSNSF